MSDRRNTNCSQIDMDLDILPNAAGIIATNFRNAYHSPPDKECCFALPIAILYYGLYASCGS